MTDRDIKPEESDEVISELLIDPALLVVFVERMTRAEAAKSRFAFSAGMAWGFIAMMFATASEWYGWPHGAIVVTTGLLSLNGFAASAITAWRLRQLDRAKRGAR